MSERICIRLTNKNQYTQEELLMFIRKHSSIVLIQEYTETNQEHYHGWIESDITEQSVRGWFKRELHCLGNQHYSLSRKEMEFEGGFEPYKWYCCKGPSSPPIENELPRVTYNISRENVIQYHLNYYEESRRRKKESQDKCRQKKLTMKCHVVEIIKLMNNEYTREDLMKHVLMMEIIISYYNEKDIMMSDHMLLNQYNYIRQKIFPEYINERANCLIGRLTR